MTKSAIEKKLVEDKRFFRKIIFVFKRIKEEVLKLRKIQTQNVVVDTHCTIKPDGYLPGLPIWVLEGLFRLFYLNRSKS